ncbi:MAG TPA: hypothetical protein VEF33_09995, partial [Syntrophales bacterium]|nr:hypothetical protein [Syntrophales bacterium]
KIRLTNFRKICIVQSKIINQLGWRRRYFLLFIKKLGGGGKLWRVTLGKKRLYCRSVDVTPKFAYLGDGRKCDHDNG